MDTEIWKDIDINNFRGRYQVSNLGRVRSLMTGKILTPTPNAKGYLRVSLQGRYFKHKQITIHRLVAEAFLPNPNNYPCINHKDECRTNNHVDNLEWCSWAYNINYGTCNNRMLNTRNKNNAKNRERPVVQLDLDGNYIAQYNSMAEVQRVTGIDYRVVSNYINKKVGGNGFKWIYLEYYLEK